MEGLNDFWQRVCLMDERTAQKFWQEHACGDAQIGGLRERFHGDYDKFFTDYDRFRYQNERHLSGLRQRSQCIRQADTGDRPGRRVGFGTTDTPGWSLVGRRPDRRVCR